MIVVLERFNFRCSRHGASMVFAALVLGWVLGVIAGGCYFLVTQ